MERILDRQNNPQSKSSWKPVLITNGVILCILLYFCYDYLLTADKIIPVYHQLFWAFTILFFPLVVINFVLLFVSLFSSKKYWKKWLSIAVLEIILFFIFLFTQKIIDFDKIIN